MKLLFATANQNKFEEIQQMLPSSLELLSLRDVEIQEEIPETQPTIEGNAVQKVEFIVDRLGIACFADDTGLEVKALDDAPGVYSARYAGPQKNAQDNMAKLLRALHGKADRSAQFKTVIALFWKNQIHQFTGILKGKIATSQTGVNGFGYDPIFVPEGYDVSLAEMTADEKNEISHRSLAFQQLLSFLNEEL